MNVHPLPRVRCQVSGVRRQVSDIRYQVSGVRCQVSNVRCQVSGVRYLMTADSFGVNTTMKDWRTMTIKMVSQKLGRMASLGVRVRQRMLTICCLWYFFATFFQSNPRPNEAKLSKIYTTFLKSVLSGCLETWVVVLVVVVFNNLLLNLASKVLSALRVTATGIDYNGILWWCFRAKGMEHWLIYMKKKISMI